MRRAFVVLALGCFLPAAAAAAPRVYRSERGRPLTPASTAAPSAVVLGFLGSPAGATVLSEERDALGITKIRIGQEVAGLRVEGAYARGAVNDRGELVHAIDHLVAVPPSGVRPAQVSERDALRAAMAILHPGGATFHSAPQVERVAIPRPDGSLAEGFVVETWTERGNLLYRSLVGGDGAFLRTELRTQTDSYNVFTENPIDTPQAVIPGPGAGNAQSPVGWLFSGAQLSIHIAGNNVNAYLDAASNNRPDRGGTAVTGGDFSSVADLTQEPSIAVNQNVGVQNLFYLNNVLHDTLYRYGFTEAAGNFQEDNFGKGGAGSDSVNAEAQDGGGLDNANFATPSDGRNPRMQMYLWSGFGTHEVVVDAPSAVAGTYLGQGATWGPALTSTGVTGDIVVVDDGTGTVTDGCEASTVSLSGAIALADRGGCNFTVKARNAQDAGAIGIIIANNVDGLPFTMGGTDRRVRIPGVMISKADGATLKGAAGLHGTERLRTPPPLMRDGDVDSDVVFHEYGHGLTWRMIGGMDGPMAGAIGEGMSDVLAVVLNGDDRVGEYSSSDPGGIRRYPYHAYPLTYGDFTGDEVHADGEIYGAIGWRLWEIFQANGLSKDLLLTYLVDGMNFTPSTPAFEDMRDGILQAVANAGSGHDCLIWQAFAEYGVGVGASAVVGSTVTVTESFDLPASCQ